MSTARRSSTGELGWRLDVTPPGRRGPVHAARLGVLGPVRREPSRRPRPGRPRQYLIVSDIEAARDALVAARRRGERALPSRPGRPGQRSGSRASQLLLAATFSDPDGNTGCSRRSRPGFPGASTLPRPRSAPQAIWRARCGARRPPTASTRSASARQIRTGPTGTPSTWWRSRPDGAADVSDYDVIVFGGGAPGEHCAAALAARGLRVAVVERELVGGECSYWACIPSKSLLRPGEAVQGARDAGANAEVDVQAALAWRDFMVSAIPTPARSAGWRAGASTCCEARASWPAPASSKSTASATPRSTSSWRPARIRFSLRFPGSRARGRLGDPRGDRDEGDAAPDARAGWRVRRRRVGAGRAASGRRGGDRRGRATVCFPASLRRWGRHSARPRRDGIELMLGMHATAARRDGDEYVLQFDGGTELRGERLLVATGRRPRVEGIGLETVGVEVDPQGSRLTNTCVPASASGRLATSPASGRSPTSANTRATWSRRTSPAMRVPRTTKPFRGSPTRILRRLRWRDRSGVQRDRAGVRGAEDRHLHTRLRRVQRVPTLLSDGTRLTGAYALGPKPVSGCSKRRLPSVPTSHSRC